MIVSEAEWSKRPKSAATSGELLANFATEHGFREEDFERPWTSPSRPLGADFAND